MTGVNPDWVHQVLREASEYFGDVDKREDAAEQRHRDLVKIHQQGWQQVARAIDSGLHAIADAIRTRR